MCGGALLVLPVALMKEASQWVVNAQATWPADSSSVPPESPTTPGRKLLSSGPTKSMKLCQTQRKKNKWTHIRRIHLSWAKACDGISVIRFCSSLLKGDKHNVIADESRVCLQAVLHEAIAWAADLTDEPDYSRTD